jgi:hypothetical protein
MAVGDGTAAADLDLKIGGRLVSVMICTLEVFDTPTRH